MTSDPQRRRPTISQVAQAAGVARSSVSRAFNNPRMLGPETVVRILRVADEMGYVPDRTARALSTGRTGNLALIVPDVANPFFPPVIQAAQAHADRHDHCVFLGSSGEDPRQEDRLAGRFAGQVDGLILVSSRLPEARILHHAARCPLVLVNRDIPGIPRVLIDSGQGVAQAIAHLAGLGHRRVVYLGGPRHSWSNRQRLAAARQAARAAAMDLTVLPAQLPTHDAGRAAAEGILATGATAVVAFDDLLAQGVMAGLAGRGVPVPGRISVVGCDDVLGAATYPALTTVSNRSDEAGRRAMSLLMEVLATGNPDDARFVLATGLVLRDSTAPPDA
ncbi:MAG: LacI family transcriptional regulator [Rhodobacteraceae bacterium]|nr:LacI family transcriptional regulator [Paracoccaceae bacterium]